MEKSEWKKLNLNYEGLVEKAVAMQVYRGYEYYALDMVYGINDKMVVARVSPDNPLIIRYHQVMVREDENGQSYIKILLDKLYINDFIRYR